MKASLQWLSELLGRPLDADDVARRLTLSGLEVEGQHRYGNFTGVIAAELRSFRAHPDAAKLRLVTVWDGASETEVVCGAPELPPPGSLIAWAKPGAKLPNGMTIEPKAVRGIVSPGMLCADDELGLSESHEGLLVLDRVPGLKAGDDVAGALQLPDTILEINVTPNRPDALGHIGIARDLAALYDLQFAPPVPPAFPVVTGEASDEIVKQLDQAGGQRYVAARVTGVAVGPSPTPVKLRLSSLGVRPISNLVDVTNLVMLEWSQPLHAFDLQTLSLPISVRPAAAGETLRTLDDKEHALLATDWVIADTKQAVALAGVMGGLATEVTPKTTDILLESAHFSPRAIRKTARRLGYVSEASLRFEKGVDPEQTAIVARRAVQLLLELGGGAVSGALIDRQIAGGIPPRRTIALRTARTERMAGVALPASTQRRALERLGFTVKQLDDAGATFDVEVPHARPDLSREIDLIEEIVRLVGYDLIPATLPRLTAVPIAAPRVPSERVRDVMTAAGLFEILSYAFGSPDLYQRFGFASELPLANPLRAELSALRPSLVPGLCQALLRNQTGGATDVRLFEVGTTFAADAASETGVREATRVAALLTGRRAGWLTEGEPLDAHDATGVVDALAASFGVVITRGRSEVPWLHPGVQASLALDDGAALGVVGQLHPDLAKKLDLDGADSGIFVLEIDLGALGQPRTAQFAELPRFPASSRDLSFFIDASVSAGDLSRLIRSLRPALQVGAAVQEDFRDARYVPAGKKGMLWSFTYRNPEKTLTDADVDAAHNGFVTALLDKLAPHGVAKR